LLEGKERFNCMNAPAGKKRLLTKGDEFFGKNKKRKKKRVRKIALQLRVDFLFKEGAARKGKGKG